MKPNADHRRPNVAVAAILAAAYLPAAATTWYVAHAHSCVAEFGWHPECTFYDHLDVLLAVWGGAHLVAAVALGLREPAVRFGVFTGIFFAAAWFNGIVLGGFAGFATGVTCAALAYPACILYGFVSGLRGQA